MLTLSNNWRKYMAFQSGDIRGTKTAEEAKHAHKDRPYNMLERSQNAATDASRASWDRMFGDTECESCEHYSEILGQCHPTVKNGCKAEQQYPTLVDLCANCIWLDSYTGQCLNEKPSHNNCTVKLELLFDREAEKEVNREYHSND
jgi:hypothetical protein